MISDRNVGWFSANIEDQPEFDVDGSGTADQLIFNNEHQLGRWIHYERSTELTQNEEEKKFYEIVRELTGEWFTFMPCDKI